MDIFNNAKQLKTKKEKQLYIYKELNSELGEDSLCWYNPGFMPFSLTLYKEKEITKHYASLYFILLDNINTSNKTLLDLCCGKGQGLYYYQKYFNFKKMFGMDISESSIEFCKRKYSGINFDLMDINDITYSSNMFDIITVVDSSINFFSENYELVFNNIHRVLNNGGTLIMAEPRYSEDQEKYLQKIFKKVDIINITDNISMSCKNIMDNIDSFGFSSSDKEYAMFNAFHNHKDYYTNNVEFIKYICYKE